MESPETLPILYHDEHLIAVAKPTGMFVHCTDEDRSEKSAVLQIVRNQIGAFVYTIHRLDRATSGALLLALTRDTASKMNQMFSERRVCKTYHALVRGYCPQQGKITTPLIPARGRSKPRDHPHAKPQSAKTECRRQLIYELPIPNTQHQTTRCSLVEITPHTGRYHQIRRHFNYESHPIIGDTSHGDSRHNRIYQDNSGLNRLMLAAVCIEFEHPLTQKLTTITCPPDRSFSAIVDELAPFECSVHGTCD